MLETISEWLVEHPLLLTAAFMAFMTAICLVPIFFGYQ